ncbi:ABC transporter permease [Gracilibacillus salitolerans]|uniref:ABC transporter permease n=1 Tax=Gracilibacillus salitolerans TaxID=2663022 RepID=A0A5Q2TJB5_9BACI|nr:ABC transporter permease [Gracilibacillus salitolerans]QGH35009.1 ABC transporter permease [Gracilibacillus salitolerans]
MKKMLLLSIGDMKNIQREPLLLFSLFGIFLLIAVIRFALPELHNTLLSYTSFPLQPHFRIIVSLALLMAPFMIGILYGFIILDERDEGVLLFYAVTPVTKTGYLFARILAPIIVTFLMSFAVVLLQGIVMWDFFTFLPIAVLFALQSPIVTMLLASLASNKVEGLALTKVVNLMLLAPLLHYLINHPLINITMLFPVYWPVKVFLESDSGSYWWNLFAGFLITLIWLVFLERLFRKRME